MSKVWKAQDDCHVMIWVGSEKVKAVSIGYSPEETSEKLSEEGEWYATCSREDIDTLYPCKCSRFSTEPANVTLAEIPIGKLTVCCLHGKPLLTRFDLASGKSIHYAEFMEFEPFVDIPEESAIKDDELEPLSFLFGMLPREHHEEAGKTNTDLSTWKWKRVNERM